LPATDSTSMEFTANFFVWWIMVHSLQLNTALATSRSCSYPSARDFNPWISFCDFC
jgi:hypothetical protein